MSEILSIPLPAKDSANGNIPSSPSRKIIAAHKSRKSRKSAVNSTREPTSDEGSPVAVAKPLRRKRKSVAKLRPSAEGGHDEEAASQLDWLEKVLASPTASPVAHPKKAKRRMRKSTTEGTLADDNENEQPTEAPEKRKLSGKKRKSVVKPKLQESFGFAPEERRPLEGSASILKHKASNTILKRSSREEAEPKGAGTTEPEIPTEATTPKKKVSRRKSTVGEGLGKTTATSTTPSNRGATSTTPSTTPSYRGATKLREGKIDPESRKSEMREARKSGYKSSRKSEFRESKPKESEKKAELEIKAPEPEKKAELEIKAPLSEIKGEKPQSKRDGPGFVPKKSFTLKK